MFFRNLSRIPASTGGSSVEARRRRGDEEGRRREKYREKAWDFSPHITSPHFPCSEFSSPMSAGSSGAPSAGGSPVVHIRVGEGHGCAPIRRPGSASWPRGEASSVCTNFSDFPT